MQAKIDGMRCVVDQRRNERARGRVERGDTAQFEDSSKAQVETQEVTRSAICYTAIIVIVPPSDPPSSIYQLTAIVRYNAGGTPSFLRNHGYESVDAVKTDLFEWCRCVR